MIVINQVEQTKTYKIEGDRISGFCDNIEALKQAVFLILSIERFDYPIFSSNYGTEIKNLFGKSKNYVYPEIERRVKEALLQDDRIKSVYDFIFEYDEPGTISVSFKILSIYGPFDMSTEANI